MPEPAPLFLCSFPKCLSNSPSDQVSQCNKSIK